MERVSCLHFDLSLAMAIHSSKSFEMPLLLSAFSNVLPQVICGTITNWLGIAFSRPNIRYKSPYIPYLLNYLLIWVKIVTYFYEP